MSINLHNYETWFLMYTDNELSEPERLAVESFVKQHPELKSELDAFSMAILTPDLEVYEPSTELIKIDGQQVETLLLKHLDNELTESEKFSVNRLIAEQKAVADEWLILQQTKVHAEHIVFEHKASLYKHTTRVFSLPNYAKLAIAAILIGAGIFFGLQLNTRNAETVSPIANTPIQTLPVIMEKSNTQDQVQEFDQINMDDSKDENLAIVEMQQQPSNSYVSSKDDAITSPKKNITNIHSTDGVVKYKIKEEKHFENINNTPGNKNISPDVTHTVQPLEKKLINELIEVEPVVSYAGNTITPTVKERKNPYAFTLENNQDTDNAVLIVEDDKVEKTKAAGLFRKVKRVIERKTNINTKESLLIGSFEIAIR